MKVLVAIKPVDFRKGMDGLGRLVKDEMKADPFSGVDYVFRGQAGGPFGDAVVGRLGVVLYAKRLEQGASGGPGLGMARCG